MAGHAQKLRRVGRRVAGALLTVLLALGPTAAVAAQQSATCCCKHNGEAKCHCPVCTHARELEEGHASLKSCGSGETVKAAAWSPAPFLPPVAVAARPLAPLARPTATPPPLHEPPDLEVKTPPPLG